jgi:hypothetical protein
VTALARPGAAPHLSVEGDQLQVTWTALAAGGRSTLTGRRLDRAARPLGDARPSPSPVAAADDAPPPCLSRRLPAGADELVCSDGSPGRGAVRVAVEPRGIRGVRAAPGPTGLAVTWQSDAGADSRVAFATVSCAASSAAAAARP